MNLRLVDPLGERFGPSPDDHSTVGEYLRALREHKGLTLVEVAKITRIGRAYLQGIEEGDRSALPSRPFAIGYVRAYAQALGIDGDAAAARFKRETPELAEPFHDPVGVAHDKPKRSPLIFAGVGLVLCGLVVWNVVQRSTAQEDRQTPTLPAASADVVEAPTPKPVVAIGAPTPAPAAQNLPTPYQTPFVGADGKTAALQPVAQTDAPPIASAPTIFTPKGAVYGAPAGQPGAVVLQAVKAASLIVRGNGGAVYFARQLAVGEAFRAPAGEGLTAEVTDPSAFAIYSGGEVKGALVSQQTALDKLVSRPEATTTTAAPRGAGSPKLRGGGEATPAQVAYYTQPRT